MMRLINKLLLVFVLILAASCEGFESDFKCYPTRVKHTVSTGSGANAVTADYKYAGELVDRIIWSNYQTHYYLYDENERLIEIERVNVQRLQKTELHFTYENGLRSRIDEYLVTLDGVMQTDQDTTYLGFTEIEYEDERISLENVYTGNSKKDEDLSHTLKREFGYDAFGNLTTLDVTDVKRDKLIESWTMTYDQFKNPYSDIDFYLDDLSYVNNLLTKTDNITGEEYHYQTLYNNNTYPTQVNIKIDDFLSEVITYTYDCR